MKTCNFIHKHIAENNNSIIKFYVSKINSDVNRECSGIQYIIHSPNH
jgi:hypothetical protein